MSYHVNIYICNLTPVQQIAYREIEDAAERAHAHAEWLYRQHAALFSGRKLFRSTRKNGSGPGVDFYSDGSQECFDRDGVLRVRMGGF